MADTKLSALTALAVEPADTDELYINDGGTSKKIAWSTVKANIVDAVEGTAILSTGEAGGTKFLREDGDGTCSWQAVSAGISEVSEDTSPTLGGDLSLGGFKLLSGASNDAVIKLGDNAGTRKLSVQDSGDVEVAYINSDGAFRSLANDGFAIAISGQPVVGIRRNSSVGGLDIYGNTTSRINISDLRMLLDSAMPISWSPSSVTQNPDVGVIRSAAGVVKITNGSTGGGALELLEQTAPSAPSSNAVRFYAEDNGSGKTRLMAIFPSGAAQQVAIEP